MKAPSFQVVPRPTGGRTIVCLLGWIIGLTSSVAVGGSRDWSAVQLAWRGDPRATADAPSGVEGPSGRRPMRRTQRRAAARRRMPLDGLPVDPSRRPTTTVPATVPRGPTPRGDGDATPITVETTLASPFAAAEPTAARTTVVRDQPYGTGGHSRQRFDLHLPAGCSGGGLPLVVWIHGDTWRNGSKADCPVRWLVEDGYAVASIGYRLSDTAVFPAQLDDCRAAVVELERNADVWGVDRDRICIAGVAAGGHLAALVGFSGPPRVAAVCAVATPTHLTSLGPEHDRASSPASMLVGGPLPEFREVAQHASPLTLVSADDPPALIVHHRLDAAVPADQAIRLDTSLRAAGVDSTLVLLDGPPSVASAAAAIPALDRTSTAGRALLEFLDRTLGPGVRGETAAQPAATRP